MNVLQRIAGALAVLAVSLAWLPAWGDAGEAPVVVHYFRADGCPHCERAGAWLQRHAGEPRIELREYEVRHDAAARAAFLRVAGAVGLRDAGVPLIVIGDWARVGYHDDASSGAEIDARLAHCLAAGCTDWAGSLLAGGAAAEVPAPMRAAPGTLPPTLAVPLFGEVDTATLSLPLLTVLLGALDGFNPCAMWALVFLLGLLMGARDRRRMWILGLVFLAGSGLVYFAIMAAWLNVLLAVGLATGLRIAVGLVALAGAAWHLHDYATNPEAACAVSHGGGRQRLLGRLRRFALEERLWPAIVGVLLLSVAVNLIELACSAGIPAIYTQVLTLTPMPAWQYYGYLALYNVVYMLDDIALFAVAATTLQLAGFGARYARASRLFGAGVLAAIGLMLLFRPQWLAFA